MLIPAGLYSYPLTVLDKELISTLALAIVMSHTP